MRERRCSERRIHNLQPLWKLHTSGPERALTGIAHSAVIGQNVYLFCASEGLGAVLRASRLRVFEDGARDRTIENVRSRRTDCVECEPRHGDMDLFTQR